MNECHTIDSEYIAVDYNTIWNTKPLQWRHNERDGVSNNQCLDCLLNPLFRHRSKKISRLRFAGLCDQWPVESPHKGPVTRKMFPFDDVIMAQGRRLNLSSYYKLIWRKSTRRYQEISRVHYNAIEVTLRVMGKSPGPLPQQNTAKHEQYAHDSKGPIGRTCLKYILSVYSVMMT